jgi:hypothetical protein
MKIMKSKGIIFLFFIICLFAEQARTQSCCDAQIVPISDCCAELQIIFDVNCPGTPDYRDIYINSNFNPAAAAEIDSWTDASTSPVITGAIINGGTLLALNANTNLYNPIGVPITLGTICFKNATSNIAVTSIAVVDNSSGNHTCEGISETALNCPPVGYWSKIYGDTLDNRPSKVKAFTDGVYVAGYQNLNGTVYATMSKFNIQTGALACQCRLDFPSRISDFEYDEFNDELILVGAEGLQGTGAGVVAGDRSFIVKLDNSCNPSAAKMYDHPGIEGFTRIVKHHNPDDPDYPYYVLGRKNPVNNAPSGFDLPMVYNIDENLNIKWIRHYDSGVEVEAYRLLVPLDDGALLIGGNGSSFGGGTSNEGVLIEIDGNTGQINGTPVAYPGVIDLYDGVDMGNGIIALAGHDFGQDMGLVYLIERVNYTVIDGLRFPDVSLFTEIGIDGLPGDLYTLGRKKAGTDNYHIMHRLSYINGINGFVLSDVYYRYLFDGETAFDEPHFSVTPGHDAIFYADARKDHPNSFGDFDMLIGSFDLDFNNDCTNDYQQLEQFYFITNFAFTAIDPLQTEPSPFLQYTCSDPGYNCNEFCQIAQCTADFTGFSNCCTLSLAGTATGVPPFIFEWDIDCNNPSTPDATGSNPVFSNLSLGPHQVCLTITDATGCSATVQKMVTIVGDNTPPILTCPPDITIPTDPGACVAVYNLPPPTADDDCTTIFTFDCMMSGATTGSASNNPVTLNKGITIINCATEDEKGNIGFCSYSVTVVDQEPPVITCPNAINTSVNACAGGITVQFPDPTVSDNCPMVSWACDRQSGDFFTCGTTIVTCTATDMAGNQTDCSFPVTVDCECVEVGDDTISCTNIDDQFAFSLSVIDLTGSGSNACTIGVSSPQAGITISGITISGTGPAYTVSGLINVAAPPMPNNITIVINLSCVCPDGSIHDCDFPITLQTPCCKEISVDPQEVCENGPSVQIPLIGCNNLYDVQQVRWYIADAPCPPASWGAPFQVTNGCVPLTLSPQYHNGDICVYAEVDMGPGAGPCTKLASNIATISLCSPVSCDLSSNQAYCWTGSPITPAPLMVSLNPAMPDCTYEVEWYDPNGNLIPSAT